MATILAIKERPLAVKDNNYAAVHYWLRYHYGSADHCSLDPTHEAKRFEWANVDGVYERDIGHFMQLCRSCHAKMDVRESTRVKMRRRKGVPNIKLSKRVGKYTDDGVLVGSYRSVAYAAKVNGCSKSNIVNSIKGKIRHCYGHLWRYL